MHQKPSHRNGRGPQNGSVSEVLPLSDEEQAAELKHFTNSLHYQAAHDLVNAGQYRRAVLSLSNLVKIAPDDSVYWKLYADALEGLAVSPAWEQRTYPLMEDASERPALIVKGMDDKLYQMPGAEGPRMTSQRLWDYALKARRRTLDTCPENKTSAALGQLAGTLLKIERYEEALQATGECLRRNPDDVKALTMQVMALVSLRRYDEALEVSTRCVALEPTEAKGYFVQADILLRLHRSAEAEQVLVRGLEYGPNDSAALFTKARLLHTKKRHRDLLPVVEEYLEREPSDSVALGMRTCALIGLKRFASALESARLELGDAPDNLAARVHEAQALIGLERYREALDIGRELSRQRPDYLRAYGIQAQALSYLKDMDGLRKLLEKDWPAEHREKEAMWHLNMGRFAFSDGNMEKAKYHADKIYTLPFHPANMLYCRFIAACGSPADQRKYENVRRLLIDQGAIHPESFQPLQHTDREVLLEEMNHHMLASLEDSAGELAGSYAASPIFHATHVPAPIDRVARRVSVDATRDDSMGRR